MAGPSLSTIRCGANSNRSALTQTVAICAVNGKSAGHLVINETTGDRTPAKLIPELLRARGPRLS